MSLTNCKECGKQISDKAVSCPNCGNPIKPVVIEQTKKRWKLLMLMSVILIIISIYVFFYGMNKNNNGLIYYGIFLAFAGFIVLGVSKFGAWWSNK